MRSLKLAFITLSLVVAAGTIGALSMFDSPEPAQGIPSFGVALLVDTQTYPGVNGDTFCSLDEAIAAANTDSNADGSTVNCNANGSTGTDGIYFSIGSGTPVINITSPLPTITESLNIVGSGNATRVELRGPGTGYVQDQNGLTIAASAPGSAISNMVIDGFGSNGIRVDAANVIIKGNFIGTDATGTTPAPNVLGDIRVSGTGVHIGGSVGTSPGGSCTGECNVISGSPNDGVYLQPTATGAIIRGNFISTDATGTHGISNQVGIRVEASGATIGGVNTGEGNILSGESYAGAIIAAPNATIKGNLIGADTTGLHRIQNASSPSYGLEVAGAGTTVGGTEPGARNTILGHYTNVSFYEAANVSILGNLIGVAADGSSVTGAGSYGIVVEVDSSNNTIGGLADGAANTIAFQSAEGVTVDGLANGPSNGNAIRGNSIYSNAGKGIETINGGNTELAPPVVTVATHSAASGMACANCQIDVFSDDAAQGHIYEGSTTADGTGAWTVTTSLAGPHVTATATNAANNTSEFSAPHTVHDPTPTPTPSPSPTPTPSPTASPQHTQGDINCANGVTHADFTLLLQYAAKVINGIIAGSCPDLGTGSFGGFAWGDLNCDGLVNAIDVLYALAHELGIVLPPVGVNCVTIGQDIT